MTLRFDVAGAAGPRMFFSRLTPHTLAHAYLFSGPPGVGKKTFARRLAQSLLCEAPKDGVLGYDGTCASCRLIGKTETRHPDLLESIGSLKIGDTDAALGFHEGDEMTSRDLVRQLGLRSYTGGLRVFVLGDVDFATHHAANALLKFLEEPPPGAVIVLTSSTPGRLLATIRSRLVEVRFSSLRAGEVEEVLQRLGYDAERARTGAALSQGSITRALASLDEEESVRGEAAQWFFDVTSGRNPENSWAIRESLDEGLEVVKTLVRDWVALSRAGKEAPVLAADYREPLQRLKAVAPLRAAQLLAALSHAQHLARTNVSPALVADTVRMALTSSKPDLTSGAKR